MNHATISILEEARAQLASAKAECASATALDAVLCKAIHAARNDETLLVLLYDVIQNAQTLPRDTLLSLLGNRLKLRADASA